jgi:hypothetical protein
MSIKLAKQVVSKWFPRSGPGSRSISDISEILRIVCLSKKDESIGLSDAVDNFFALHFTSGTVSLASTPGSEETDGFESVCAIAFFFWGGGML